VGCATVDVVSSGRVSSGEELVGQMGGQLQLTNGGGELSREGCVYIGCVLRLVLWTL
jgi:hypothetical protein